jgi:hypothetical protein
MMSSILGTIFYTIVVFVLGAFVGRPAFSWLNKYLPWNMWQ